MLARLIGLLLDVLARWRGAAQSEKANRRATEARVEALRDRSETEATVEKVEDAMAKLRSDWKRNVAIAIVLGLSACAPVAPEIRVVDTGCDWTKPILVEPGDQMVDRTARSVLAHNETWARRCRR